jgi:hypothetical protein
MHSLRCKPNTKPRFVQWFRNELHVTAAAYLLSEDTASSLH